MLIFFSYTYLQLLLIEIYFFISSVLFYEMKNSPKNIKKSARNADYIRTTLKKTVQKSTLNADYKHTTLNNVRILSILTKRNHV